MSRRAGGLQHGFELFVRVATENRKRILSVRADAIHRSMGAKNFHVKCGGTVTRKRTAFDRRYTPARSSTHCHPFGHTFAIGRMHSPFEKQDLQIVDYMYSA